MKKIFACIIAILMIATFAACQHIVETENSTTSIPTIPQHAFPDGSMPSEPLEELVATVTTDPTHTNNNADVTTTPTITEPIEHKHSLVESIENEVAPTCTKDGGYDFIVTCSTCNETISNTYIVVSATGHIEVVDAAVSATCTQDGITESVYCSVCDEILVAKEIVPAIGHVEVVNAAVNATCITPGKTEGTYCTTCNETLIAQDIIPATGHVETINPMVPATCTGTGKTESIHCSVCNYIIIASEVIHPVGHTEAVIEKVTETCTTAGKTEGTYCSTCNQVLVAQQVVSAKGHTTIVDNAVEPTCTKAGKTEGLHCIECIEILVNQNKIKELGHTPSEAVKENVRANGAYESVIYCSVCNAEMIRTKIYPTNVTPIYNYFHIDESIYEDFELEAVKWIVETLPIVEQSETAICPSFTLGKTLSGAEAYATYQKISSLFYIIYGEEEACDCVMDFVNAYKNGVKTQYIQLRYHDIKRMAAIRDQNLAKIDDILKTIPAGTETEILYEISEYIRTHVVYTKNYYDVDDALSGKSVCNGYALLFNMMANRAGIISDLCVGPSGENSWHAYNRVTLEDGSYRYYDMTFYDGGYARPKYIDSKTAWDRRFIINDYSECWNGQ